MSAREPVLLDPLQTGHRAKEFESRLRRELVGQDDAVREVVRAYQRFALGINTPGRPVGCLLFLGPTGTGKTRLVETAAKSATGDARSLIRIDCGEFQHGHEIAKLTGSPPGYLGHRDTHPLLSQENLNRFHTESLKLSFVLFDELEKASDALWNLLLGVLEKTTLTLGDNRQVDFSSTIIFMTANVGAAEASKELTNRFGLAPVETSPTRVERITAESARRRFPPEFLNRIDKIVVFHTLGERELREILDIELRAINQRLARNTRFLLSMSEGVKGYVLREGSDVRYGARYLKRVMERSLVDPLCNLLATGQIRSGDQIRVDVIGDSKEMLFYRDRENVKVPPIPASEPSKTAQSVASAPTIDPASPGPPIVVGCCF